MPISKSKRKKQTGQPLQVGRFGFSGFGFSGFGSQVVAFRLLGWAAILFGVLCLGGSTLGDVGQRAFGGLEHDVRMGDNQSYGQYGDDGRAVLNRRHALLRQVNNRVGAVRLLHPDDLVLLFGAPSLERVDGDVRVWQFASGICALDVYFRDDKRPVYAEYRVRGSAEAGSRGRNALQGVEYKSCVLALYEGGGI